MNRKVMPIVILLLVVLGIGIVAFFVLSDGNDDTSLRVDAGNEPGNSTGDASTGNSGGASNGRSNTNPSGNSNTGTRGNSTTPLGNITEPKGDGTSDPNATTPEPVALTLTGVVLDSAYEPLASATVSCALVETQSGEDGRFSIEVSTEAGKTIVVSATKSGHGKPQSKSIKVSRKTTTHEMSFMLFNPASLSGKVFKQGTQDFYVGAVVHLSYEGFVKEVISHYSNDVDSETSTSSETSTLSRIKSSSGPDDVYQTSRSMTVADDGSYSFNGLRPGWYKVYARHPHSIDDLSFNSYGSSYGEATHAVEAEVHEVGEPEPVRAGSAGAEAEIGRDPSRTVRSSSHNCELAQGMHLSRDLYLEVPRYVTFTITNADPGSVRANLVESWYVENGTVSKMAEMGAKALSVDEKGVYRIGGLSANHGWIWIKAANYASKSIQLKIPQSGDLDLGAVTLDEGSIIEGIVVDGRGRALAGVAIIRSTAQNFSRFMGMAEFDEQRLGEPAGVSDEAGRFVIKGVDAGMCFLSGAKEGLVCNEVPVNVVFGEVVKVTITMLEAGSISGRITRPTMPEEKGHDENDPGEWDSWEASEDLMIRAVPKSEADAMENDPSARFMVGSMMGDGSNTLRILDDINDYRIENLVPGEYVVKATWRGLNARDVTVTLSAGGNAIADIRFPEPATLYGTITGADGQPHADKRISLSSNVMAFSGSRLRTNTDATGSYRIEGIAAGTYMLRLDNDDEDRFDSAFMRSRSVQVSDGESKEFNLDLSKQTGATLRGKITANGEGGAFRRLILLRVGLRALDGRQIRLTDDGKFEATGLDAGDYYLYLEGRGDNRWRDHVTLNEGQEVNFERDYRTHSLAGVVTLVGATAAGARSDARVAVAPIFDDVHGPDKVSSLLGQNSETCSPDGEFRFENLVEGEYEVSVSHPDYASETRRISISADTNLPLTLSSKGSTIKVEIKAVDGGVIANTGFFGTAAEFQVINSSGQVIPKPAGRGEPFESLSAGGTIERTQLSAGTYTLRLVGWLIEPWSATVTVNQGEEKTISASLHKAASLKLKVSNANFDETLVDQSTLEVTNAATGLPAPPRSPIDEIMIISSGQTFLGFVQGGLTAGTWKVTITVPGYKPFVQSYTVERGKELNEEIVLVK